MRINKAKVTEANGMKLVFIDKCWSVNSHTPPPLRGIERVAKGVMTTNS